VATRLGEEVAGVHRRIESLARSPATLEAAAGSALAREAREAELAYDFPDAWRVRLVPAGVDRVQDQALPPFGYAALDMVRRVEAGGDPAPAELHLFGQPEANVVFARPVRAAGSDAILGHLVVHYRVEDLLSRLGPLAHAQAGVELRQDTARQQSVVLYASGGGVGDAGPRVRRLSVAGTRWHLLFVPHSGVGQSGLGQQWSLLAVVALAVVLLGGIVFFAMRHFAEALRQDMVSLINITRALAAGRPLPQGTARVSDLAGTFAVIRNIPAGLPVHQVQLEEGRHTASRDVLAPELGVELDLGFAQTAAEEPEPGEAPSLEAVFDTTAGKGPAARPGASVPGEVFRGYDIRGVVATTLTPDLVERIGAALGSEAYERGQQSVIVARDGRSSGESLCAALVRGLQGTGRDVIDIGMVPTPVLYFATHFLGSASGVMVTGSHNPPDWNGLKMVLRGEHLSGEAIQALRARIEAGNLLAGEGGLQNADVLPDYVARITSDVSLARPLKVVVDCGNGVASLVAGKLYRALGCDVHELFCEVDGSFPHHHPDPSQPENLEELIAAVKALGADLGLAFDGDGDRLGVVAGDGNIVWPDRLTMLLAEDVLSRNPGAVVLYDVKSTGNLGRVIRENGGRPLMWKSGHSPMKAKMKDTGALLGGEMSGHLFFKERWFGFDDALYAGARLLEVLSRDPRTVAEVFAGFPDMASTPELRLPLEEGQGQAYMDRLLQRAAQIPGAEVNTLDGLRADFEEGWGLVRASNTTPALVMRFEGKTPHALRHVQDTFRRLMLEVDPSLRLPF
jgi:phosphomannomutase/phosphoglucomutase